MAAKEELKQYRVLYMISMSGVTFNIGDIKEFNTADAELLLSFGAIESVN